MAQHLGFLFLLSATSHAFVSVPFQTTKYYGYDGPWQAITAQVGGFFNGTISSAQWTSVDLMPGGFWDSYILSNDLCVDSDPPCAIGGSWNPGVNQTQDGDTIDFEPTYNDPLASGLYMTGSVYGQTLNVGASDPSSATVPNATMVAVDDGNITLPDGQVTNLELGTFALGADAQTQVFGSGSTSTSDLPISTWLFPGYLYNSSQTKSYSYAIHIGSTAFDYVGSLMFGGYDKGRAIGPVTSWGDSPPQLLDIVMGVETGGSPFSGFSQKSGLLLDNTSTHNQLPVFPEPLVPYLHLPQDTCDNLVKHLPVYYDKTSQYYLWNTSDPSYTKITSSAGYLGFVFPPATGGTDDVTIKVPFALLNLTLEEPAISSSGKIPYFPCRAYTPPGSGPGAGGSGLNSYLLGRAFLQAAFVGRNWNQHVSWMAQAPGPGPSKQGMGYQPQDIQDTDTTLDLYSGDQYFNQSWTGYWTPLPGATPAQPATNSTNSTSSSSSSSSSSNGKPNQTNKSSGLSSGAIAGIAIGAAAVILGAIAIGAFLFLKLRKKEHTPSESEPFVMDQKNGYPSPGPGQQQQHMYDPAYQNTAYTPYTPQIPLQELPQQTREPSELADPRSPLEMDGSGQQLKPQGLRQGEEVERRSSQRTT